MISSARSGILTAGTFLIDYIKVIDRYPQEDMLAMVLSQARSNGGGPYNMLKNLSAMKADFPLSAACLLGDDADGKWIENDCRGSGVDTAQMRFTDQKPTSYTDVMSNQSTGRRTFFHQPGANALFDGSDVDFDQSTAKILHLGHLMILESLDTFLENGHTNASRFLERASRAGLITSVDFVSTEHASFREIALSAMQQTDYLIINEIEAGRALGRSVSASSVRELTDAARELVELGVRRAAVIHTEHGAVVYEKSGAVFTQAAVKLPAGFIKGANGAGDAFASGFLYGVHENWAVEKQLQLGVCAAAACLSDPTPSNGMLPVNACFELCYPFGYHEFND